MASVPSPPQSLDQAIAVYGNMQMKLKKLAETNRERREPIMAMMKQRGEMLQKFMEEQKLTCMAVNIKDQKTPVYLRLQGKTKYLPVTEEVLKEVVEKTVTPANLQIYYKKLLPEEKPRQRKKLPTVADVLVEAVTDELYDKLSVVSSQVKVSKTKERGFKCDLDHLPPLPDYVSAAVSELHQGEQGLKMLRQRTIGSKRKYEEIKNQVLPVLSEKLKSNETQEVDVHGLDGKLKTYVMSAVAVATKEDAKTEEKKGARKPSTIKITVKAFEDAVENVADSIVEWQQPYHEAPADQNALVEVRKRMLEMLMRELKTMREKKHLEMTIKRAEKAVSTHPVSIKMRLKGRTIANKAEVEEDPEFMEEDDNEDDD